MAIFRSPKISMAQTRTMLDRLSSGLFDPLFSFPAISCIIAPNDFARRMRSVMVKEVMWCWSCNKVMEHDVSNHPGSAGGRVPSVCKGFRTKQVEKLLQRGPIRDFLRSRNYGGCGPNSLLHSWSRP